MNKEKQPLRESYSLLAYAHWEFLHAEIGHLRFDGTKDKLIEFVQLMGWCGKCGYVDVIDPNGPVYE